MACGITVAAAPAAFAQDGDLLMPRLVTPAQEKVFRPAQSVARACGLSDVEYTAVIRAAAVHLADAEWVSLCRAIGAEGLKSRDVLVERPDFVTLGQANSPASNALATLGLAAPFTVLRQDAGSLRILVEAAANARRFGLTDPRGFVGAEFARLLRLSDAHVQSVRRALWTAGFTKPDEDLAAHPGLLNVALPADLRARVRFFRRSGCRDIAKLIANAPLMLRLSLDTMASLDERLESMGMENTFNTIAADPMILTHIKDGSLASRLAKTSVGSCPDVLKTEAPPK